MIKDMTAVPAPGNDDDSTARLDRSVVLIGLMGAGKTSIGRILAERLGLPFVDADAEIERAAGATIEEIFARDGEAVFRSGERRVIERLLAGPPAIIATGGGAFMDASTRATVRERGISVWLKADLETLVKRTARRGGRPLLAQGDPREVLARLMAQRYPIYGEADVTVETGEEPAESVTDAVIAALEAHIGASPLAVPTGRKNGNGNGHANGNHRRRKNRRARAT